MDDEGKPSIGAGRWVLRALLLAGLVVLLATFAMMPFLWPVSALIAVVLVDAARPRRGRLRRAFLAAFVFVATLVLSIAAFAYVTYVDI